MEHRHLLPEEIDLLLDGEVGFGIAPLQAHIRSCPDCRSELDTARALVAGLEHLPHLAPSRLFAERVMAQVQVIEPVHVAAVESARRWLPQSRPLRVLAGVAGLSVATVLSIASIWIVGNLDALLFFGKLVGERARAGLLSGIGSALAGTVADPTLGTMRVSGMMSVLVVGMAFIALIVGAAFGLRAVASTSRRRRG